MFLGFLFICFVCVNFSSGLLGMIFVFVVFVLLWLILLNPLKLVFVFICRCFFVVSYPLVVVGILFVNGVLVALLPLLWIPVWLFICNCFCLHLVAFIGRTGFSFFVLLSLSLVVFAGCTGFLGLFFSSWRAIGGNQDVRRKQWKICNRFPSVCSSAGPLMHSLNGR